MLEGARTRKGIKVSYETHLGKVRKRQEDYLHIDAEKNLFIVADGMGGHERGDEASKVAVEAFVENYVDSLADSMRYADRKVLGLSKHMWSTEVGPGTTLIAAVIDNNELNYCSVGDSYLYLYKKDELKVINTLDEEPPFGWLTQALGGHYKFLNPHSGSLDLESGDIVILATDGIDSIYPKRLKELCDNKSEDLAKTILDEVLTTTASDNITLICLEIE